MQKRYHIAQQCSVQQFRQMAREENPNIHMIVPMAEVAGLDLHVYLLDTTLATFHRKSEAVRSDGC